VAEDHASLKRLKRLLEGAIELLDEADRMPVRATAEIKNARAQAEQSIKRMKQIAAIVTPALPEGAWAMLLDLFANEGRKKISVSSACIASGFPGSTGLRWIKHLVDLGMLTKEPDGSDGRRIFVALTPKGREAVLRYLRIAA
jgi:hypothetical protein